MFEVESDIYLHAKFWRQNEDDIETKNKPYPEGWAEMFFKLKSFEITLNCETFKFLTDVQSIPFLLPSF